MEAPLENGPKEYQKDCMCRRFQGRTDTILDSMPQTIEDRILTFGMVRAGCQLLCSPLAGSVLRGDIS